MQIFPLLTRQFFLQLVPKFYCAVARQVARNVACCNTSTQHWKIHYSVAGIVAISRTNFFYSQRLRQQKSCETCSFQGMLHWAIFSATCIATKLPDKLQKRLPSVTAPRFYNDKGIKGAKTARKTGTSVLGCKYWHFLFGCHRLTNEYYYLASENGNHNFSL